MSQEAIGDDGVVALHPGQGLSGLLATEAEGVGVLVNVAPREELMDRFVELAGALVVGGEHDETVAVALVGRTPVFEEVLGPPQRRRRRGTCGVVTLSGAITRRVAASSGTSDVPSGQT